MRENALVSCSVLLFLTSAINGQPAEHGMGGHPPISCPSGSRPLTPRQTCLSGLMPVPIPVDQCGPDAFCQPSPNDGDGLCCTNRPSVQVECPVGSMPVAPRLECPNIMVPVPSPVLSPCGTGAFCHPSPADGPGLCCRPVTTECPSGFMPMAPRQTCGPQTDMMILNECGPAGVCYRSIPDGSGICCKSEPTVEVQCPSGTVAFSPKRTCPSNQGPILGPIVDPCGPEGFCQPGPADGPGQCCRVVECPGGFDPVSPRTTCQTGVFSILTGQLEQCGPNAICHELMSDGSGICCIQKDTGSAVRCPTGSMPLIPRKTCPSIFLQPQPNPNPCGDLAAFCQPSPVDGPGLCCINMSPSPCPSGMRPVPSGNTCPVEVLPRLVITTDPCAPEGSCHNGVCCTDDLTPPAQCPLGMLPVTPERTCPTTFQPQSALPDPCAPLGSCIDGVCCVDTVVDDGPCPIGTTPFLPQRTCPAGPLQPASAVDPCAVYNAFCYNTIWEQPGVCCTENVTATTECPTGMAPVIFSRMNCPRDYRPHMGIPDPCAPEGSCQRGVCCRTAVLIDPDCPPGTESVIPRQTCQSMTTSMASPPDECGQGAFCVPPPFDGPGLCCRELGTRIECPPGSRPKVPQRQCSLADDVAQCGNRGFCYTGYSMMEPGRCCLYETYGVGECPANEVITNCPMLEPTCLSDTDCISGRRCCPYGCGMACREPVYPAPGTSSSGQPALPAVPAPQGPPANPASAPAV